MVKIYKSYLGKKQSRKKEEDIMLEIKNNIKINKGTKLQVVEHLEKFILINLKMYVEWKKIRKISSRFKRERDDLSIQQQRNEISN